MALGKKIIIVKNATAYTWDWYYHLVVDRTSLAPRYIISLKPGFAIQNLLNL